MIYKGQKHATFLGDSGASLSKEDEFNSEELDAVLEYKKGISSSSESSTQVANQGSLCPLRWLPCGFQNSLAVEFPGLLRPQEIKHESITEIGNFLWNDHQLSHSVFEDHHMNHGHKVATLTSPPGP
jgi:hypothetical protein